MEGFFIVKDITYERLATKNPIGVDGCIIALSKGYGHLTDTSLHWHHAFELTLVLESDIRYVEKIRCSNCDVRFLPGCCSMTWIASLLSRNV